MKQMSVSVSGFERKIKSACKREVPSLALIWELLAGGATLTVHDSAAMKEAQRFFGDDERIRYADLQNDALTGADALAIVTEWTSFRRPNFDLIDARLKRPPIVAGRNLYDPAFVRVQGFDYAAVGR